MFRNYFITAMRNFWKNRTFSFINITGLALGMACSLLILLWVQDERSIDAFHKNGQRLYSIYERQFYDGKIEAFHGTPGILADEIKKKIPEIEFASGMAWDGISTFSAGNKIMKEHGTEAGADFFKMFSYPLLAGTTENALNSPLSIAVSRKMAMDFFDGPAQALGKTIRFENDIDLKITAVFEDFPKQSSLKADFFLNWELWLNRNTWAKEWGNNGPMTLIQLRRDADARAVEKKITRFLDHYNKDQGPSFRIELGIQRFDQKYLYSNFKNGKLSGGRIEYVRLFSTVAVFILLIGCINFMNLTTARSVKRSKEIGIRKVVGAVRPALIKQFLGEAVLLAFFALVIALLLVILFLPMFNDLTGKRISLPFGDAGFWIALALLTFFTGIISGSYPALFLSAFQPVRVLKGTPKFSTGAGLFRKGLVVFQFVLSTVLIIGTIVISKQVEYIQTKNLGYDRENFVYIPLEGELLKKYGLFKEQGLKIPGVIMISRMSQNPTEISNGTGGVEWEGKDPNTKPMFTQASVGYDFVKTMKLQLLHGRDFSKDFSTDTSAYLVNEAAAKKMNFKDAVGKPITFWEKKGTIVGVLKDFHYNSFRLPINPIIIRLNENDSWGAALVRIEPFKTKQALAGLEKLCRQINPEFPFTSMFSDEEYTKLYKTEQTISTLSTIFACLAIFISCLGLLGLTIFTAEQRIKEMGIRKILGAGVASLFSLLSREFLILVGIALIIAFPVAWWMMNKWLLDFEYRISINAWIFLLAAIVALLIALTTVSFHAIKAALANPVKSLRTE